MGMMNRSRRAALLTGGLLLATGAPALAVPGDLTDYFNDGTIATQEWMGLICNPLGPPHQPATLPIWAPFFGSDGASMASAIVRDEDIRRGRLSFDAPKNRGTNSWNGYIANGWTFDPRVVGDPMGMPDECAGFVISSTADGAMDPDDDPELEDRPMSFQFSIEARFADRRPPTDIDNGAKNGLSIAVMNSAMDLGFDNPLDRQFAGNGSGGGGFEVFIENDNQPGLALGVRPAGSFPGGGADQVMRLPQGQKFDGRISVSYVNDNGQGGLNQVTVTFTTKDGPIFMTTLGNVFAPATQIIMDSDAETVTYGGIRRPTIFIGAVSVMPNQDFNAKQAYFDNFIMGGLMNQLDQNPMPTPLDTDLDDDGDVDAVDVAAALTAFIPVEDELLSAILTGAEPSLNPNFYLKDRQYFRAVGRWYRDNILPTFAGERTKKEKRADRKRLKGLRNIF